LSQKVYRFYLQLSAEQVLWYYQGHVKSVVVLAESGEKIQLELKHFKPFIRHHGVKAYFELVTTEHGNFIAIKKIN
jgi:hypothetical protein